jgi:hypothetical protein
MNRKKLYIFCVILALGMLALPVLSSSQQAGSGSTTAEGAKSGTTGGIPDKNVTSPEAKTATPTKEGTPKDTTTGTPFYPIVIYALILAFFITLPTIIDICKAYNSRKETWLLLINKASQDGLTKEELQALIQSTAAGPPGISGMSRALMALAVIIILGIAVFHLLGTCQIKDSTQIVNNVLSMLAATLASITGFYFGGRSAEEKKTPEAKAAGERDKEKEEAKKKAEEEEEEAKRKAAEEEAKKKAAEEAKKKAEEEANKNPEA